MTYNRLSIIISVKYVRHKTFDYRTAPAANSANHDAAFFIENSCGCSIVFATRE